MRIKNYIAVTAMAALPLIAAARPASPELMRHVNSDGTTVEFRLHGNENFSYMTDPEGINILEFNEQGNIVTAMRDGVRLQAVDADLSRLLTERPGRELINYDGDGRNRMAALETTGANRGRTTFPTIGNDIRSVVILLEFPDRPFVSKDPLDQFSRLCNEPGYSDYKAVGSARDYYEAASNGKFTPHFDVFGPVKMAHEASYYTEDFKRPGEAPRTWGNQPRFGEAIKQAIDELDPIVDFSIYDYDKDGVIDNVFFFYSGVGQADTGDKTAIWPHQSDYRAYTAYNGHPSDLPYLEPDGVKLQCYACSNELNSSRYIPEADKPFLDGIGAFCHEFAHVLGLPDLYDTLNGATRTPGDYSILDHGSYNQLSACPPLFSAYEQWLCKWIEYTDAVDGESYTLHPMTEKDRSAVRLRIRRAGGAVSYESEYYVIETRREDSWDSTLPDHGIMIWRINYDNKTWTSNRVNVAGKPNVEIIGSPDYRVWPGPENEYPYIDPSMKILTPSVKHGSALDVYLTNLTYNYEDGTASFDYNKYLPSDLAPVMYDNPTVSKDSRQIHLKWSEVPEAESYLLTVYREDETTGNIFYVDGLDDYNVGNKTNHTVRNIRENQWDQKFRASIRIFLGVPAAAYSNEIEFIPSQLQEGSGVEGIEAEIPMIYGGKGCITAPEDARVYTLGGIECGRENLPAGIYIVVARGATAKVTVR